jgi:serine kinase of HPr protein (carbohydrate metabolism regulator)
VSETVHASCVAIDGRAVLIAGASGCGKSDLALRLIDRGAGLVSDDYTALETLGATLLASPPATIAGRIEVRGVGIVERPHVARIPVALLIDLDRPPERMPEPATVQLGGISIPAIGLSALEASAPIKVEAALQMHGLPLP